MFVLLSLIFASLQWLDSHDAKIHCYQRKESSFFLFQGLAFAVFFP